MIDGSTLGCPKEVSKKQHTPSDGEFLEEFSFVVTHYCSDPEFTTAVAATILGMSRMHLNRRLRSLTGQATHECILERRIAIAKSLLTQPLPVAFVAQSVGFKSVSHFSKTFRRSTGMPPSAYRAMRSLPRQPTARNNS
jgi:AraC-like DNA-binding protein